MQKQKRLSTNLFFQGNVIVLPHVYVFNRALELIAHSFQLLLKKLFFLYEGPSQLLKLDFFQLEPIC